MKKSDIPAKHGIPDILIKLCICACALFTVCIFIYGQFFVKNPSLYSNKSDILDVTWYYTDPDGVTTAHKAPDTFDVSSVDEVRLTMTLPDEFPDGSCLFILSGMDLDAYIDGELRNSYRISRSVFGNNVKGMWLAITLRANDRGRILTIVRPDFWPDEYTLGETYIGNRLGFVMQLIHDNILILFFGFALVVLGFVTSLISLLYMLLEKRTFPLWYLSIGVLAGAVWLIMDNFTYPMIFQNYFVDGITEFLLIMLVPFPFAAYFNSFLGNRYRKLYYLICLLIIADFLTLTILHFTDTIDYLDTMIVSNVVIAVVAVSCLCVILCDTFIKGHRENTLVAVGSCIFAALCISEIVHVNLPFHTNDGIFVSMALLIILLVAVTHEILRISELRAQSIEAHKANQAKTTFLANMSHEIRTPINAILGMDELILRENVSPRVKEYAHGIKSAGTSLLEIISDVLDFSKIEQGKMDIVNAEYSSRLLIMSIITMIGVKADEKGLAFEKNISEDLPSKFIGDERRIREVMVNLLGNAVKYTNSGSVTLTVRHESIDEDQAYLHISVRDTGIGIKDSDKERLFKQFERLDLVKTRSVEGTGLGLAISSNLIRLMDGAIECESVYGEGTEFTVRIPQLITDHTPIGDILSENASGTPVETDDEPADLQGVRVLIVDDNELNLKVARGLLDILGVTTTTCMSGSDMLDLITIERFDIVLLDHMMPEMDGIEALERSKTLEGNINPGIPYIALTANAIAGAREMYLEKGFTAYLSKPITLKDLSAAISSCLGRR
ncbi:MAG: response regulator [Lachnospiraceae bacterium]|nr:response regulator [Lachnospiraceae bacterium]